VLQNGAQQNFQASIAGTSAGTRFTLSGNYFDQTGVIPGQGLKRGSAFGTVDHTSKYFKVGASASLSRAPAADRRRPGCFGYATARTPFGSPLNYTTPGLRGLYDPRPTTIRSTSIRCSKRCR
jgi:hypothetical protein